jgi:4-alpha-glucanotransferase
MLRSSGILMHLSSLPSSSGIGTLGKNAWEFVDFLKNAGQSYWQILPIGPTSYGDSPYQSVSTFAGNPYFIEFEELEKKDLLKRSEYSEIQWGSTPERVDYGMLYEKRYQVLQKAVDRFLMNPTEEFQSFCQENAYWLEDYALFMTIKDMYGGLPWTNWEESLRNYEAKALEKVKSSHPDTINFWKVLQYFFFEQWSGLRTYANEKGISIIGDLPFYVALDSVDVWAHPELFQLDENKIPVEVAGCPPDGFSATGQLWGNPLFDWEQMEKDHYKWWISRIGYLCKVYNVLRIDHFRGFDSYYAIPYGDEDAKNGYWKKGPGMKLFTEMEKVIGKQRIIAEDLGFLTDSVRQLLKDSGFPGMKVLEFAFDKRDASHQDYLPYKYDSNCVAYTGTHDNDTVQGWLCSANPEDIAYAKEYMRLENPREYHWGMMQVLWSSGAGLTIVQAQDLLGLGSESRMNTPSTLGKNWTWRALPGSFDEELAERMLHYMELYGRASQVDCSFT